MCMIEDCRHGIIRSEITEVANTEGVSEKWLCDQVALGKIVVTSGHRGIRSVGIGEGLRKKFGTIVGTSSAEEEILSMLNKAKIAIHNGSSAIHDGSAAGDIEEIHHALLQEVEVPIGFDHPIRVAAKCYHKDRNYFSVESEEFLSLLEEDAASGCEILLGPFSVTRELVEKLRTSNRIMPSPNKTGSLMIAWIERNKKENPYLEQFDRVLQAAKENDVILSFVNGFRPGCIEDAMDEMQLEEIRTMRYFIQRALKAGVQVKAGGGGHVPLDKIPSLFQYEKQQVKVPIISFGPQVTDISVAYDHVIAAVGQSHALMNGADMVLTITAAEHLALPIEEEVKESCIIAKHVCHSVDLANGKDLHQDITLSKARERLDWETQLSFSLDRPRAEKIRWRNPEMPGCSVCGNFCAYLTIKKTHIKQALKFVV